MFGNYIHSKVDQCSGVAARERGQATTGRDHQQCGDNDHANNAPDRPSPRITLGVRTDIEG